MKKGLCILLTMVLMLSLWLTAGAEEVAPLTVDEVDAFLEVLREEALQDENLTVVPGEEGAYHATFAGGMLMLAEEALHQDTAIVGAELNAARTDLRELKLVTMVDELPDGAYLSDVLAAYPCDNASLYGTYEEAVVAMSGDLPGGAFVGVVKRSGQMVNQVVYYAYETVNDVTVRAAVVYHFNEGQLLNVTLEGAREVENAAGELAAYAALQEEMAYFAYPSSQNGSELDMFAREDLTFSGLDFLTMDYETLAERFGTPASDEWLEDTDGSFIRTCVWDGIDVTFQYDAQKQFVGAKYLVVTGTLLEGPRGAKVGDSLTSLIYRFRHGENESADGATMLYGTNGVAPCGQLRYEGTGAYLTYLAQVPDGTVGLYLNCENMQLTSYMLAAE